MSLHTESHLQRHPTLALSDNVQRLPARRMPRFTGANVVSAGGNRSVSRRSHRAPIAPRVLPLRYFQFLVDLPAQVVASIFQGRSSGYERLVGVDDLDKPEAIPLFCLRN